MTATLRKMIHVACRDLGLDQDARRALQLEVCGKTSMSDMTNGDMNAVLARLRHDGFVSTTPATRTRPIAPRSDLRLCHVLWRKLGEAGELDKPGRDGLNAFIRKQFGDRWQSVPADIDMLRDPDQINAVIRALKAWGKRASIDFDFERGTK